MPEADQLRAKATHCRSLVRGSDERSAANLEMLATAYDEEARRADIAEAAAALRR